MNVTHSFLNFTNEKKVLPCLQSPLESTQQLTPETREALKLAFFATVVFQ